MSKISSLLRSNKDSELWKGVSGSTPFSVDDILNNDPQSVEKEDVGSTKNLSSSIAQQNLRTQQLWIENIRKLHLVMNSNPLLLPSCLTLPLTYPTSSINTASPSALLKNYSYQNPTTLNILSFYDEMLRNAQTLHALQRTAKDKRKTSTDDVFVRERRASSTSSSKSEKDSAPKRDKSPSSKGKSPSPPLSPIHALEKLASNTFNQLESSEY